MCFSKKHLSRRAVFHPYFYRKRKFLFYSESEINADPSKKIPYGYAFVVDKDAPIFFIAPGGGYCMVCISYEGAFIAEELNRRGINAFVLNYRVGENAHAPNPQEDMASLIKYVFANKEKFGIARDDYSVLGFSAGGHLVASFATENVGYKSFGLPKPRAAVLCYPVLTMGENTHRESMLKLTDGDETLRDAYSVEKHADNYPPCFIWYCADDKCVPPINSDDLYRALKEKGIPVKLCAYKKGGHGLGLGYHSEAAGWMDEMTAFLKDYIY
ncbi:MAG: alpha/beta hydrolase [Clostridia bacterium]|nr:alpha/beta hydrolase [Clostridia bacterium]